MKVLKIHYLQHVPYENLGCIEHWVHEYGHKLSVTKFWDIYKLPNVDDIDVLIVLGGPMSIFHDDECPWLGIEKQYIKKAIDKGKKVLGICLGAQLIADRLGADVYRNNNTEIGWFPLMKNEAVREVAVLKSFPPEQKVFHWHGDTFDIPEGALRIASSEACVNQGFIYKDTVLAIQFHLEMTNDGIKQILANCYGSLTEEKYIQSSDQILENIETSKQNNEIMFQLLSSFLH